MSNVQTIVFKGAEIRFPNFAGRAKPNGVTPEGQRSFVLVLDPETADNLSHMGVTVKEYQNPDGDITYTARVKVQYGSPFYPDPEVYQITSRGAVLLDETTVGSLDFAEIQQVDLSVKIGSWKYAGKSGKTLYLQSLYATLVEDELKNEYAEIIEKGGVKPIVKAIAEQVSEE